VPRPELVRIGLLSAGALVFGALTGAWGWAVAAALALYLIHQAAEFARFSHWAQHPLRRPFNRTGLWHLPVDRVFHSLRTARDRSRALARAHRRMRVINAALPDAALLINHEGEIEAFNSSAERLLGLKQGDMGKNLVSLIRLPQLVELVDGRLPENIIEMSAPTPGNPRLEVRRIPIDESLMLLLVRDVTQLNRLLTMRQDFIANVSHELRTPLTIIIGYLEALEDQTLDGQTVQKLVGKLASPAQRMKALVDDLLLLTRLESSPPPALAELDLVNISRMLRTAIAEARQLSDGRHRLHLEADASLGLLGVEQELHSAFNNLIANAVRYSPEGGNILVRWYMSADGPRFQVTDEGIGIPPEHLSRITERFYRVDLARERIRGGTGLGLAIVKHVLKRHDTSLQVESLVGKGSTFHCVFPTRRAQTIAAPQTPRTPASGA
jgi:two-component system, OmpR family, phosphate regulon sensor histidine kinase PhoR